jgi:hypothetical protein
MMASPNPIERSFELAAERCEDLTPLVYRRLFDAHPEARTMFHTEGSELVKGSMLALTIDAILDFAGERTGHFRLIISEISSHDAARDQQKWKPALRPIARYSFESAHDLVAKPRTLWWIMRWHAARIVRRVLRRHRADAARHRRSRLVGRNAAWRKLLGDIESLVAAQ